MRRNFARRAALASSIALAAAAPLSAFAGGSTVKAPASFAPFTVSNGQNGVAKGGEPSVGFDPKRNALIYGATAHETRMVFHDKHGRTTVQQTDVSAPTAGVTTLDSITFTDRYTGRTFDAQLLAACSAMSYSDNAGASWTPTSGCGQGTLLDHESVGGGPFHAPLPKGLVYPDAVYYCAQNGFNATCAVSLDGGLTFGPGQPISNTPGNDPGNPFGGACSGLHGHLKVGPDGTAYVPLKGCHGTPTPNDLTNTEYAGGQAAVSVSQDNGLTWQIHVVPGSHNQDESDNAVDVDKGNRLYMAWEDGTNPSILTYGTTSAAKTAYSDDEGKTWSKPVDLSSALGVHNVQFPQLIAGDKGRAAIAFIGTKTVGNDQHNGFKGKDGKPAVWDLYVSLTYDGGKHWTTMDVTPHDPVQRGCVLMEGLSNKTATDNDLCSQRNLLDFNDITMDNQGRVLVAYTDGCTGKCIGDRNYLSKDGNGGTDNVDMVMRLSGGKGLVAKYDGRLGRVRGTSRGYKTAGVMLLPLAATVATRQRTRRRRRQR